MSEARWLVRALPMLMSIAIWFVLAVVKQRPIDPERAAAITVRVWYVAVVSVLLLIVVLAVINNR